MRNKISRQKLRQMVKTAEALHEKDPAYKRDADRQFYLYLMAVVIAALAIRLFLFEPVRVDGSSMKDTLIHNEYMFVEKMTYWFREPERGEIITCFYPGYTVSCVKRVIAVGGDTISIWGGKVYVNGVALVEDYWNGMLANMDPVTVPEGHVFVMGDNRGDSKDSRAASVGTIPLYRIVGKCRAVIWPLSHRRKV